MNDNIIVKTAKEAGKMILAAGDAVKHVKTKGAKGNYVTEFDSKIQAFIRDRLKSADPQAEFMGEEDGCDVFHAAKRLYVVDPIDGTTNFIRGNKHSCVSVALLREGKPFEGAVYDPYLDELFYAEAGKGATLNGEPIHVSDCGPGDALVSFGSSPYYKDMWDATFDTVRELMNTVSDVRRCASAALDLCWVAAGRYDLFYELRLSPWDFSAGGLIVTEAGGVFSTDKNTDADFSKPALVIAGNPECYEFFKKTAKF